MASVGMMDPAYFVGKVELLTWLNELLKINYTKVEQVCLQQIVARTQPLLSCTPVGVLKRVFSFVKSKRISFFVHCQSYA